MLSLGMDIGTSTVKLVLLKNQEIEKQWMAVHHGRPFACLKKGLSALELDADTPFSLCVTGSNTEARTGSRYSLFGRHPSDRRGCALDHSAGGFGH